jgi:hypothetical protein
MRASNALDDRRVAHALAQSERAPLLSRGARRRFLASLIVLATIACTWLLSGVSFGEAFGFAWFQALYVLLPGLLACAVLSGERGGWLRALAIGVPLGYAIDIGAFALTAAVGARPAFALLPLAALAAGGPALWWRSGRAHPRELYARVLSYRRVLSRDGAHTRGGEQHGPAARERSHEGLDALLVALALSAGLVLLAFTFFASAPLPGHAHSVVYSADNVFDISLAAEARNHWPITEPWVAGEPLRYYTGVFIHVAAVNQVAGVPLATTILRLLPTTMFLVVALQLWFLGSSLRRSRWVGPLSVALLLVVADVNLNPTRSQVFHISPFTQFPLSPSFAFGAPFLLGVLALLGPRLGAFVAADARDGGGGRDATGAHRLIGTHTGSGTVRTLAMVAILVLGAASSKMFAAVDLLGGLGLYWLWSVLTGRPSRLALQCLVVSTACVAIAYFAMLAGGGAASVRLDPLNFVQEGNSFERARTLAEGAVGHSLYWLPLLLGGAVLVVLLFAPLLGGVWLLRRRGAIPPAGGLAGAVFAAGLLMYVLLGAPGGVEGVFLVYGYIAVVPLAALGLVWLWEETPPAARRGLLSAGAALLAIGLAIAGVTPALALKGHAADAWYALAYGLVACGVAFTAIRLRGHYALTIHSRVGRTVACGIPLLIALGLVKPTALAASGAWKTIAHRRTAVANSASEYGLTSALYTGLTWVRDHTSRCDVLAVSNHFSRPSRAEPNYLYYSAFTERRIFLESWFYTPAGTTGGEPYPRRLALNEAAMSGNPTALRELALDGVSYVLIDKLHGGGPAEPASVSRAVFDNSALEVYRLRVPDTAGRRPLPCATVR